jgi:hypothetical protein
MGWCECGAISKARVLLRSDPEDLLDVMHLAEDVILCQLAELPFANHVHRLIARDGSQRPVEGSEPQSAASASNGAAAIRWIAAPR